MSKIYCDCGNIVSLDKAWVRMKKALKKRVECGVCRNHRISMEIDHINGLFDGTLDDVSMA
jgi:5-methylcytosine-specific restriction endonuclease McrA